MPQVVITLGRGPRNNKPAPGEDEPCSERGPQAPTNKLYIPQKHVWTPAIVFSVSPSFGAGGASWLTAAFAPAKRVEEVDSGGTVDHPQRPNPPGKTKQ